MKTFIIAVFTVLIAGGVAAYFFLSPSSDNESRNRFAEEFITTDTEEITDQTHADITEKNPGQRQEKPKDFNPFQPEQIEISFKNGTIQGLPLETHISEIFGILGIADVQNELGNKFTETFFYKQGMICVFKDLKLFSLKMFFALTPDRFSVFSGKNDLNLRKGITEDSIIKLLGQPGKYISDGFSKELMYKTDTCYIIFSVSADDVGLLNYAEITRSIR